MVGLTTDEARQVVEQVTAQLRGLLPEAIELAATLVTAEPGRPARELIEGSGGR